MEKNIIEFLLMGFVQLMLLCLQLVLVLAIPRLPLQPRVMSLVKVSRKSKSNKNNSLGRWAESETTIASRSISVELRHVTNVQ